MKYEKSCGTITLKDNKVLLVTQISNICGFPKGHIENDETEMEAAIRETKEETNVSVRVDSNYRYLINYVVNGDINKDVVYFLASVENDDQLIKQEEEIAKVEWVDIDKVRDYLTFDNLKELWDGTLVDIKNNFLSNKRKVENETKIKRFKK